VKAVIWSKDDCPQCENAIKMLENNSIDYEIKKLGTDWSKEDLLEIVPFARSVPQIFFDDEYIGGVVDLKDYLTKIRGEYVS